MNYASQHKAFLAGLALSAVITGGVFLFIISQYFELQATTKNDEGLREEEVVVIRSADSVDGAPQIVDGSAGEHADTDSKLTAYSVEVPTHQYIKVADSCGADYVGECVHLRSGPGTDFSSVSRLRTGQVFKVGGTVERDDRTWYKLVFHQNEWLRYPERINGDWYVAADYVQTLTAHGPREEDVASSTTSSKKIVIDRSEQQLTAYEDGDVVMQESISTGLELTPTPAGTFAVFRKTPSRYMQGPIPGVSSKKWDLPGVPWVMYFTQGGAAIHGTYWHNSFGQRASAGCVNMSVAPAEKLYRWADLGTTVVVEE